MSFNIGSQQAGLINNVTGDQTIHGGQHVAISSPAEALTAVEQLRNEIKAMRLPKETEAEAEEHLKEIQRKLEHPEPDKPTIGDRLARLTQLLVSAGALATAGTALVTPISGLATWLGAFGASALGLLHGSKPATS
jgi:hypothetical protein